MIEQTVVAELESAGVIPVASLSDASQARRLAETLLDAGLPCLEITFRTSAAAGAIEQARQVDGMLVGAGTVRSGEHARLAAGAGASFAVAPGLDASVVARCAELSLPFFPGVATPTEVGCALALGRTVMKVFPASACGGPRFLRAIAATYPEARFIPTGGIDADVLADYLAVDAVLACGGSWMVPPALLQRDDFEEIGRLARRASEVAACRG